MALRNHAKPLWQCDGQGLGCTESKRNTESRQRANGCPLRARGVAFQCSKDYEMLALLISFPTAGCLVYSACRRCTRSVPNGLSLPKQRRAQTRERTLARTLS